ncbi:MAG: hypothetical protein LBQ58_10990, partial [Synergistaceae bacterium]|nr:hypothetical protein [Synergistaceae bacterium]
MFLTVCTFVLNILASQALAIYPGAHGPALKEFHEGFRELRWGDSLSDFTEERILVKTDGLGEYYSKIHEDLQFGGVKVKQIIYGFNESHYLRSVMIYAEPDTFFALK